jgi:predicted SAM-dependent methyltransferase
LKQKTNLFHDKLKLLHFAPERCFQALASLPNLDYLSADLEPGKAMVSMDITVMSFGDDCFDVILCSHVLEHVEDDRAAMSEMYRVLRPGGWAAIMVPSYRRQDVTFEDPSVVTPEERTRLFGQANHVRRYGRDIKNRLEEAGFVVRVENYNNELSDQVITTGGLKPRTRDASIYMCSKPDRAAEGVRGSFAEKMCG